MEEFKVVQSVKVNPTDTVKCLCVAPKNQECIIDDEIPHNFIVGNEYDCCKYEGVNGAIQYTVIYKSDDYQERIEGTKFFPTQGQRSSHFLDEDEFNTYFIINE